MRADSMPKSQWASMISSPLFMSVAESMVIFGPISHVGCRSACSGSAASISSRLDSKRLAGRLERRQEVFPRQRGYARPEALYLFDEGFVARPRGERGDLESIGEPGDQVQGLRAHRAGAAQDGDADSLGHALPTP